MGFWSGGKKVAGHLVDVRVDKWVSYSYLKAVLSYLISILQSLTKPEQTHIQESFQDATERLNLSADDLSLKAKQLQRLRSLFLYLTFGLLSYAYYTFINNNWMGTLMTLSLALYAAYQTFRFHFWHYQLTQQRLGCTLKECLYQSFRKHL